jgi:hypothetical protein
LEIADWLSGLSPERYAETFRDNAIDVAVLPELSDADLEKLGVLLGYIAAGISTIGAVARFLGCLSTLRLSASRGQLRRPCPRRSLPRGRWESRSRNHVRLPNR